jgi:Tat protein translocase TatB subunit
VIIKRECRRRLPATVFHAEDAKLNIFEILVVLALALIVLGPERLPEVLRVTGKLMRELRLASNTVINELTETLEEPRNALRDLDPFKPESKSSETPPRQP